MEAKHAELRSLLGQPSVFSLGAIGEIAQRRVRSTRTNNVGVSSKMTNTIPLFCSSQTSK